VSRLTARGLIRWWQVRRATAARARHQGPPVVLVGTHHKTGTVWMRSLFSAVAAACNQGFYAGSQSAYPAGSEVFFQDHCAFDLPTFPYHYRGLHLIRDPRDVVISAARYHPTANEPWLDRPARWLGGQTYRASLLALSSVEERIRFEMDGAGGNVIRAMVAWNTSDKNFLTVKYEDLIQDVDLVLFRRIFTFLGYPDAQLDHLCKIAWENSLFSGRIDRPKHVHSGKPAQWREVFSRDLSREFHARFGSELIRLGYETDAGWCQ
jgi:hypothetical protein